MSYGHALKTNSREADSVAAYEKSIELSPEPRGGVLEPRESQDRALHAAQLEAMRAQLARADLSARGSLSSALRPRQRRSRTRSSTRNHSSTMRLATSCAAQPSAIRRRRSRPTCSAAKALYTREFFAARSGYGTPAADPIFIVGLPRAGSTLHRADSREPLAGRRHDGAARHSGASPDRCPSAGAAGQLPRGRWHELDAQQCARAR